MNTFNDKLQARNIDATAQDSAKDQQAQAQQANASQWGAQARAQEATAAQWGANAQQKANQQCDAKCAQAKAQDVTAAQSGVKAQQRAGQQWDEECDQEQADRDQAALLLTREHIPYAQEGVTHHKEHAGIAYEHIPHDDEDADIHQKANKDQAYQPRITQAGAQAQASQAQGQSTFKNDYVHNELAKDLSARAAQDTQAQARADADISKTQARADADISKTQARADKDIAGARLDAQAEFNQNISAQKAAGTGAGKGLF